MESPNLVKVVAAFVAGVVIALGSALIYVRVSEMVHPQPAEVAQTAPEPTPEIAPAAATAPLPDTQPADGKPPEIKHETKLAAPPPVAVPAAKTNASSSAGKKSTFRWMPRRQIVVVPAPRRPQPRIAMPELAEVHQPSVPVTQPVKYEMPQNDVPTGEAPALAEIPLPPPTMPIAAPQPHVVTLAAGMPIPIRLAETLSTDHNYAGDTFRGTLAEPIISDGFIIAERGSKVLGRVISADRGSLSLTLNEINTTDGQRIAVGTEPFDHRGASRMGQDAATIAGGAVLGAIIGAAAAGDKGAAIGAGFGGAAGTGVAMAMPHKAANLAVETRLTFRLSTALTITEKLN